MAAVSWNVPACCDSAINRAPILPAAPVMAIFVIGTRIAASERKVNETQLFGPYSVTPTIRIRGRQTLVEEGTLSRTHPPDKSSDHSGLLEFLFPVRHLCPQAGQDAAVHLADAAFGKVQRGAD